LGKTVWKILAQKIWHANIQNTRLLEFVAFFAISAFLFRGILSGLVFVGDLHFPLYPERLLEATKFAVYSRFNLGVNNILGWVIRAPYVSLVFILYELTQNVTVAEFLYFVIIFWLAEIFMYLLLSDLKIENRFARFLGSVLYIFNPWICDRLAAGHILVVTAFALIPLVFWSFNRFLSSFTTEEHWTKRITYACVTAIALGTLSVSFHVLILTSFILAAYFLFFLARNIKKVSPHSIFIIVKYLLFWGILVFLLCSYWSWPMVIRLYEGSLPLRLPHLESFIYYSRNANLLNALRGDVYWFSLHYTGTPAIWAIVSIVMPFTALLAPILDRGNKKTTFFFILAILGISFSLGSNNPANIFFFNNLPFFPVFQDPDKFSLITIFAYSFLFSASVSSILRHKKIGRSIMVGVILVSLLLMNSYIQLDNINGLFLGVKLPREYLEINELMDEENGSRVIWMPLSWSIKYSWAPIEANGYTDQLSKLPLIEDPVSPDIPEKTKNAIDYVYSTLALNKTKQFGQFLSLFNGKYVVFRSDLEETWQASYKVSGYPTYQYILDNLLEQLDLQLIYKKNDLALFENSKQSNIFYATSNAAFVASGIGTLNTLFWARQRTNVTSTILYFMSDDYIEDVDYLLPFTNAIIIGDIYDLVAYLNRDKTIECSDYINSSAIDSEWTAYSIHRNSFPANYWFSEGEFVFKEVISTDKKDLILQIPFHVQTASQYEILIRVGVAPIAGQIVIELDGEERTLMTLQSFGTKHWDTPSGFRWMSVFSKDLTVGNHNITVKNIHGFNTIDELLIIETDIVETTFENIKDICVTKDVLFLGEAEKIFSLNNGNVTLVKNINASNGAYLFINGTAELYMNPFFAKDALYTFEIRFPFSINTDDLELYIDNRKMDLQHSGNNFSVLKTLPLYLEWGFHKVTIRTAPNKKIGIDSFLYYDSEDFLNDNSDIQLHYEKINPSEYNIWITSDGPFFLGFSQAYDENWVLSLDKGQTYHFVGFDLINVYLFNSSFSGKLRLAYAEQAILDAAWFAHYVTLLICACWIVSFKFRHKLNSFFKSIHHNRLRSWKKRKYQLW